jgi:hypothetical protein
MQSHDLVCRHAGPLPNGNPGTAVTRLDSNNTLGPVASLGHE